MKRYIFTIDERTRWGDVTGTIYNIKNNKVNYITEFSFRLGSCRGEVHEAFNALIKCGEIPQKYYTSSVTAWSGAGYFEGNVKNYYSIERVGRY